MAELSAALAVPTSIRWDVDGARDGYAIRNNKFTVSDSANQAFVVWHSPHSSFQVQWRIRYRNAPKQYESFEDWGEWGDWQGSNESTDDPVNARFVYSTAFGSYWTLDSAFSFSYDWTDFDAHQYEFRVRVLDGGYCSEWGYSGPMLVRFAPSFEFLEVVKEADGIGINVRCSNKRSIRARIESIVEIDDFSKYGKVLYTGSEWVGLPEGGGVVPIEGITTDAKKLSISGSVTTYDGAVIELANQEKTVSTSGYQESLGNPTVVIEDVENGAHIQVWDSELYDAKVIAEWDGPDGEHHSELVTMTALNYPDSPTDTVLIAEETFLAAPVGVDVTYWVTIIQGAKWSKIGVPHKVPRDGLMVFASEDRAVSLKLEASVAFDYTPEAETVKCADRERPVARLGVGGTRKLTAKGTVLSPELAETKPWVESAWLGDVNGLKGKVWHFRDSSGYRGKVLVKSVSTEESYAEGVKGVAGVSISMVEVD